MPRYELVEGSSSKFWDITLEGSGFTVRFGRIGTDGQAQTKSFASPAVAQAEHDKLVKEKTKKGYSLVGSSPSVAPAAAAAAPKAAPAPPPPPEPPPSTDGWIDAGGGYALGIRDEKIVARNAKGKTLASVPKELKEGEAFLQLQDALELLENHAAECREQVETWMLRSLPVPRAVLCAVWPDEAWRGLLENTVVVTDDMSGVLRGVDEKRGLGVVTLDGDTVWIAPETVSLPHPILLGELDEWRSLLAEVGLRQGLSQLFRETFVKPAAKDDDHYVEEWSGAEFDLLAAAMGEARRGGWRVRGGAACCSTWEGGKIVEARYDLGEGDPMYETVTGSLYWVDPEGTTLALSAVGPVAWSEGMRMAATIHRKRKVEEKKDGEDG